MKTFSNLNPRIHQQVEMAGETVDAEVGQDKQEQTSLILIEELQVEMTNLRAEVQSLNNAIAANNHDDRKASLELTLSDTHQESPNFVTNPLFIPGGEHCDTTNASTSPSATRKRYHSVPARRSMIRTVSVLNRMSGTHQAVGDDGDGFIGISLDDDTFTLMTITRLGSKSWTLGSMTLASQILIEQIKLSDNSSTFNVPFKVTISVRLAQLLSIALSLAMQSEILTSVRAFLVLGKVNSNWVSVIGRQGERKSLVLWLIYVAFPNMLKFVQGFLVLTTCLVVIVQADDIIVLLKDFTALMVVSEIDNVLFELAAYGYLGEELRRETERIKDITVIPNINASASTKEILDYRLRESAYIRGIFLLVLSALLTVWATVVVRQENGTYFKDKYPNCGIENFELAKKYFGDRDCYGGALNTLACKFEDGDCVEFNIAYPNCKGFDNLINVESKVGNEECDEEFAISECAYDGGDCCPLSIIRDPLFGDGQCNGGKMGSEKCGYDDGDCNNFISEYPNCFLDSTLSEKDSSDGVIFGNGICESSIYASEQCGYESKDCGIGQIGQDVIFFGVSSGSSLYFSTVISKDGSKVAVGMPRTTKEGKHSIQSPGTVRIYQYDIVKKRWLFEDELFGSQDGELFGFDLQMSSDAKQIIVGSPDKKIGNNNAGEVNIFRFSEMNTWVKIDPHPLPSNDISGFRGTSISLTDNGSRLAISIPFFNNPGGMLQGAIQVFDFDSKTDMWDQVGQDIYGKENTSNIGQFYQHLNSGDGSRIFFSSGYFSSPQDVYLIVCEFNEETQEWEQVSEDIPNPFPTRNPLAISANGHRFAMSSYATDSSSPGQVQIFQLEEKDFYNKEWKQLGSTLKESTPSNGDGFGTSLSMSAVGDFLAISTVNVKCNGVPQFCPTGHIHLFRYRPNVVQGRTFVQVPLKPSAAYGNVAAGGERFRDHNIVGTAVSLSADGSKIFINGFDSNKNYGFVKAYIVKELFYDECIVPDTEEIGNGSCYGIDPYISPDCGYDGEDCDIPQKLPNLPDCILSNPGFLGDGACNQFLPFNSKECNYDGGDCAEPTAVEGYPNCFVSNPEWIGNGICDQGLPYNSFDCGFDGKDCSPP